MAYAANRAKTMGLRKLLRQGTNLSPLRISAALASALTLAGVLGAMPASAQIVDEQGVNDSVFWVNNLNCNIVPNCIIITTIGDAHIIDLANSGILISTAGMGINTGTSGTDSDITIENLGAIHSSAQGILASALASSGSGLDGIGGGSAQGSDGADGADGFNGANGGAGGSGAGGIGSNGTAGAAIVAGNGGDVTILSDATILSDSSMGILVTTGSGNAEGGNGGDGGNGEGGDGGNGGDSIVAGGDGGDAIATNGQAIVGSIGSPNGFVGNGGNGGAGGAGGSGTGGNGGAGGAATGSNVGNVTITSNEAITSGSIGILVNSAGGSATGGEGGEGARGFGGAGGDGGDSIVSGGDGGDASATGGNAGTGATGGIGGPASITGNGGNGGAGGAGGAATGGTGGQGGGATGGAGGDVTITSNALIDSGTQGILVNASGGGAFAGAGGDGGTGFGGFGGDGGDSVVAGGDGGDTEAIVTGGGGTAAIGGIGGPASVAGNGGNGGAGGAAGAATGGAGGAGGAAIGGASGDVIISVYDAIIAGGVGIQVSSIGGAANGGAGGNGGVGDGRSGGIGGDSAVLGGDGGLTSATGGAAGVSAVGSIGGPASIVGNGGAGGAGGAGGSGTGGNGGIGGAATGGAGGAVTIYKDAAIDSLGFAGILAETSGGDTQGGAGGSGGAGSGGFGGSGGNVAVTGGFGGDTSAIGGGGGTVADGGVAGPAAIDQDGGDGGLGGAGGTGLGGIGGAGGAAIGGAGGAVAITSYDRITSAAFGILTNSGGGDALGGAGGTGGNGEGGDGGAGGDVLVTGGEGGDTTLTPGGGGTISSGSVSGSAAIDGDSGDGGAGGAGGSGTGGTGGAGGTATAGDGGNITVTNHGDIENTPWAGIQAISQGGNATGGNGGTGGNGTGGLGGDGGDVLSASGAAGLTDPGAIASVAGLGSVFGFGGNGGNGGAGGAGTGGNGGAGGSATGGDGGNVTVNSYGDISTTGEGSIGIYADSSGRIGTGGNGGNGGAGTGGDGGAGGNGGYSNGQGDGGNGGAGDGAGDATGGNGGAGGNGTGGDGGEIWVNNYGDITTSGDNAHGIFASSSGGNGTGGNGGWGGLGTGGVGGDGGDGGNTSGVANDGGDGGNGGTGGSGTGGNGGTGGIGTGGDGGDIDVYNSGSILTTGLDAHGIVATSSGGSGTGGAGGSFGTGVGFIGGDGGDGGTGGAQGENGEPGELGASGTGFIGQSGEAGLGFNGYGGVIVVENTGLIDATGYGIYTAGVSSIGILNSGVVKAEGTTVFVDTSFGQSLPESTVTVTNDGGAILSEHFPPVEEGAEEPELDDVGIRGMAIDVSSAPHPALIDLVGNNPDGLGSLAGSERLSYFLQTSVLWEVDDYGYIFGDIDIEADDTILVEDGLTVFDGVVNPNDPLAGQLVIDETGKLVLIQHWLEPPSSAYVDNFVHEEGGILVMELTPSTDPGDYSTIVTNTADIAGTFTALYQPGLYDDFFVYENVIDANLLTGGYDAAHTVDNSILLVTTAVEENNNIDLVVERTPFDDVIGLTKNQQAVGGGIESTYDHIYDGTQAYQNLVASLFAIGNADDYGLFLDQLTGAEYAQHLQSVLWSTRAVGWIINERMECAGDGAAGYAQADGSMVAPTADVPMAVTGCFVPGQGSVWGRVYGSWNSHDGDENAPGYDEDQFGVLVGFDYSFDENWFAGVAGGYFDSDMDFNNWGGRSGSSIDYDGLQLAAYGGYDDSIWYLRGVLAYGTYDGNSHRLIEYPGYSPVDPSGDPSSDTWSFYGETGYRWEIAEETNITPFLGLSLAQANLDSFTEGDPEGTGAALRIHSSDADSAASRLGLRFMGDWAMGAGSFIPELSVAWEHEFDDTKQSVDVSFAGGPSGTDFSVVSAETDRDSALVEVGGKFAIGDTMDAGLYYNGRFNSDYTANAITGRIGFKF